MMFNRLLPGAALLAVAALGALAVGCGEDEADMGMAATETDGAFMVQMAAHHDAAIAMAEVAQDRAEHPETQRLADDIIDAQDTEIGRFEDIHQRMFGEAMAEGEHGSMGMSMDEMGMDMEAEDALATAKPFDRAFIDAMVPHHQGAIRMARVALEQGEDPQLQEIAEAIIAAQSAEIEMMNRWRERWYGSPSPAGGVPPEEETPWHEEMGHDDMDGGMMDGGEMGH